MPSYTLPVRARALKVSLVLVLFILYWFSVRRYIVYDGEMMVRVTQSLWDRHSFVIQDPLFHIEPYTYFGIGVSLLLIPLYALGELLLHDGLLPLVIFEPLVTALTAGLLLSLLVRLGVGWVRALIITLVFAFGSLAWFYSGVLYSDQLVGLMLIAAIVATLHFEGKGRRRWLMFAGIAMAVALLARWDALLLVVLPVAAYAALAAWRKRHDFRERVLDAVTLGLPIALAFGITAWYDLFRYGHLLGGPYAPSVRFSTPVLKGIFGLLLSPGAGLLIYLPIAMLAPFGVAALCRRHAPIAILLVAVILVRFLFYARWADWDGANWGPRFLVPILPLIFTLIAFVPMRRRWVVGVAIFLGTLGIAVELVGQLVPYGMYYTRIVPVLSTNPVVVAACHGCSVGPQSEIIDQVLDWNLRYAPLRGQVDMIRNGLIDPTWARLAPILPLVLAVLVVVFLRLLTWAAALDGAEPGSTARLDDRTNVRVA